MGNNATTKTGSLNLKTNLPRSFECGIFEHNGFHTSFVLHPEFAIFGCSKTKLKTAAFLSKMLYWTGKGTIARGWVIKKSEDWEREICLNPYEIRLVVKNLQSQKILERRNGKGNVPMYRIDWGFVDERLVEMLSKDLANIDVIQVPKTPRQRQMVSLYLKGHTEYQSYEMTYSTNGKSPGQIESKAKKEFAKWQSFIKEAKKNPAEHLPKLNGKYINAPISKQKQIKIDVPVEAVQGEFKLEQPKPSKPKAKRNSKKTNKRKLEEFTNEYLEVFTEVHKEAVLSRNPQANYVDPNFKKDGKERNNIRLLVKFIQEKLIEFNGNNFDTPLDIPLKDEKNALRIFLHKATKVNDGWYYNQGFVPSWINSQKSKIYDLIHNSRKKSKSKVEKSNFSEKGFDDILSKLNNSSLSHA